MRRLAHAQKAARERSSSSTRQERQQHKGVGVGEAAAPERKVEQAKKKSNLTRQIIYNVCVYRRSECLAGREYSSMCASVCINECACVCLCVCVTCLFTTSKQLSLLRRVMAFSWLRRLLPPLLLPLSLFPSSCPSPCCPSCCSCYYCSSCCCH